MAQNGAAGKSHEIDYESVPAAVAGTRQRMDRFAQQRQTAGGTDAFYAAEYSRALFSLSKTVVDTGQHFSEDRAAIAPLGKEWQRETQPLLAQADATTLSVMLDACRRLYIVPDDSWMQAWQARSLEVMQDFSLQRLAGIFHNFAQCRILPSKAWYAAWQQASIREMENGDKGHAGMLFDHALLQIEPTKEWMDAWTSAVRKRELDKASTQNIILAHRGLGWPVPDWLVIDMPTIQADVITNPVSVPERLFSKSLSSPSRRQRMQGVIVTAEEWNPQSLSHIDFVLREKSPSGRTNTLYVQIDGPSHFMECPNGETVVRPTTALQTRIIEKNLQPGEGLIRLSYREFQSDPEKATQRALDSLRDMSRPAVGGSKHGHGKRFPLYPSVSHIERAAYHGTGDRGR